jgi:thiol:disulfide interchange protein
MYSRPRCKAGVFALSLPIFRFRNSRPRFTAILVAGLMSATQPRAGSPPSAQKPRPRALAVLLLAAAVALAVLMLVKGRGKPADPGAGAVRWQSLSGVASAARSEKKPILYDFTAAWCPPCHRLDREGWGDSRIADLVNGAYAPARVMDREREDGRNSGEVSELQRRYRVEAFPTLVVAAADGTEIARAEGYRGRAFLVRFLQENGGKTAIR